MKHKKIDTHVYITLSERNLKQLQKALDMGFASGLVRRCEDNTLLHVRAESDAEHYKDRPAGPGMEQKLSEGEK